MSASTVSASSSDRRLTLPDCRTRRIRDRVSWVCFGVFVPKCLSKAARCSETPGHEASHFEMIVSKSNAKSLSRHRSQPENRKPRLAGIFFGEMPHSKCGISGRTFSSCALLASFALKNRSISWLSAIEVDDDRFQKGETVQPDKGREKRLRPLLFFNWRIICGCPCLIFQFVR